MCGNVSLILCVCVWVCWILQCEKLRKCSPSNNKSYYQAKLWSFSVEVEEVETSGYKLYSISVGLNCHTYKHFKILCWLKCCKYICVCVCMSCLCICVSVNSKISFVNTTMGTNYNWKLLQFWLVLNNFQLVIIIFWAGA